MPEVIMPKLSDTMEEGKIIRWLKQRGDRVAIGDILAEVETDKANMELEAFDEGVLAEIRTAEGESAPVGAVIAVLGEEAGDGAQGGEPVSPAETPGRADRPAEEVRPAPTKKAAPEAPADVDESRDDASGGDEQAAPPASEAAPSPRPAPAREQKPPRPERPAAREEGAEERVRASPLARRVARDRGVDLSTLTGSGPGGRIVERDVEQLAATRAAGSEPGARPRAVAAAPRPAAAEAPAARVELGKIRRATAKRMAEAKRDVPHFYASGDIAMDECVRLKDGLAALGGEYTGITYTHLVLKAAGIALRRVREMNASFDGDTIVLHDTVHVALATATDDGLVVPVVRDCDRQPLGTLVVQARALVERARAGAFAGDDLRGATFTVSNLGMYPVAHFAAIVNPPQAAILAVGAVRDVPVVRAGAVLPGHVMTVTLSCDHRAVDGAIAGRFLKELKAILEAPLVLVAS